MPNALPSWIPILYLLRPIYMEYSYVEFVCKCIYVYFTYILDGAGTGQDSYPPCRVN